MNLKKRGGNLQKYLSRHSKCIYCIYLCKKEGGLILPGCYKINIINQHL